MVMAFLHLRELIQIHQQFKSYGAADDWRITTNSGLKIKTFLFNGRTDQIVDFAKVYKQDYERKNRNNEPINEDCFLVQNQKTGRRYRFACLVFKVTPGTGTIYHGGNITADFAPLTKVDPLDGSKIKALGNFLDSLSDNFSAFEFSSRKLTVSKTIYYTNNYNNLNQLVNHQSNLSQEEDTQSPQVFFVQAEGEKEFYPRYQIIGFRVREYS